VTRDVEHDGVIVGASYYPLLHDPQDWERDVRLMAEYGLTVVRTLELMNSWDRIEPVEGRHDFAFADRFLDLLHRYGMQALLGDGAACPPAWLALRHSEVRLLSRDGIPHDFQGRWGWACPDHPAYTAALDRYQEALIARYRDHPALYGWQVHNEVGLPARARWGTNTPEIYCYCEHSKAHYRGWLRRKYGTLDALNDAWRWDPTNVVFTSWEEIEPTRSLPHPDWGSVTKWLDWRLFWKDNITRFVRGRAEFIRARDSRHPISTNIFALHAVDPFGVLMGMDHWQLPEAVDVIGYDLYPRKRFRDDPAHISFVLDYAKSSSPRRNRRVFWMNEIESGPIGGWLKGPEYATRPRDIGLLLWESVGHGSKVNLFQGWRDWDQIPLHWGALVDLDGDPVPRAAKAREVASLLGRHAPLFGRAYPPPAEVAILHTRENAIVLQGIDAQDFLVDAVTATYRTLWWRGFTVDFVSTREVEAGTLSDYGVVFAPQLAVLSQEIGGRLATYVREGGLLVCGPQLGRLDHRGWFQHRVPGCGLDQVLGFEEREVEVVPAVDIIAGERRWQGYWHRADLQVHSAEVEVLATFNGNHAAPAVLLRPIGAGGVLYFGTQADVAAARGKSTLFPDMVADVLRRRGLTPIVVVEPADPSLALQCHRLESDEATLVVITNQVDNGGHYQVRLRSGRSVTRVDELIGDRGVVFQQDAGTVVWEDTWPVQSEARVFAVRHA
jgi:beta-galactosidase